MVETDSVSPPLPGFVSSIFFLFSLVLCFFFVSSPPVRSSPLFLFEETRGYPPVHSFSFSFCPSFSSRFFFWFYPPLECHAVPCSLFLMQESRKQFSFFRVKKMNCVEVLLRFGPWCFESFVIKPLDKL